jgi:hypothetical protein
VSALSLTGNNRSSAKFRVNLRDGTTPAGAREPLPEPPAPGDEQTDQDPERLEQTDQDPADTVGPDAEDDGEQLVDEDEPAVVQGAKVVARPATSRPQPGRRAQAK